MLPLRFGRAPGWLGARLSFELVASLMVCLAVVSIPSILVTVDRERQVLEGEVEETGRQLAILVAAGSPEALLVGDYTVLDTMVELVVQESPDIVFAHIERERDGKVVSGWPGPAEEGAAARPQGEPEVLRFSAPVILDDDVLGRVVLGISKERSSAIVSSRVRELALQTSCAFLALGVLLVILLRRAVLRPLERLDAHARELSRGDLDATIELRSRNELGRLAHGLETMRRNLRASYAELRERNEQLDEALREAKAGSEAKSAFLAAMSHEVRTPMNGVIGTCELLLESGLEGEQRELASSVRESGDALLGIFDGVLEFSRIESGGTVLDERAFELRPLVAATAAQVEARAGAKGLDLSFAVDDAVPERLRGDAGRLRQVLLELLGNAVKFTPGGAVRAEVSIAEERADGPTLRFDVADTGIGVDEGRVDELFEPFTQADLSSTRAYGGTGLGLAIARKVVELLGGEVGVSSRLGEGSTFWFTARLAHAAVTEPEIGGPVPGATAGGRPRGVEGKHVLLAEDNEMNQRIARRILEKRGLQVSIAENGRVAVEMSRASRYDLVLMDWMMPEMDGLEATRAIRLLSDPRSSGVPIVALTANAQPGDREQCLAAGMDDYLSKPIRIADLDAVLDQWLDGRASA